MNYLDIILSVFLLAGVVRGFLKGFIYEVAVLGALFLGYYLGFKFADTIAPKVQNIIHIDGGTLHYITFFIIWLAVTIGMIFLAKLFTGLIDMVALGIFNKIAGAVFGLLKHLLIAGLVIYFFNKPDTKYKWLDPDTKAESKLYYPILKGAKSVMPGM